MGITPELFLNLPFIILLILTKSFSGANSIIFKFATVTWKENRIKEILFYFHERTPLKEEASCEDHAVPSEIMSWLGKGPPSLPTSGASLLRKGHRPGLFPPHRVCSLFCSGRSEESLERRVQRTKTSTATPRPPTTKPRPPSADPACPARGALTRGPRAAAS